MSRAIIYVSADAAHPDRAQLACLEHCQRERHEVVSLILGDRAGKAWIGGVLAMLADGEADIVVMPDASHQPDDPRIKLARPSTAHNGHDRQRPQALHRR